MRGGKVGELQVLLVLQEDLNIETEQGCNYERQRHVGEMRQ